MSRDPNNESVWNATRKVDGEIEYLVSKTTWSEDPRFAKVIDAQKEARAFLKSIVEKGTVRKVKT